MHLISVANESLRSLSHMNSYLEEGSQYETEH